MKKNTNKRMTKRIAVIITAVAVAVTGVTVCAATYLKGDVDGNGKVNLKDAQLALRGALCIEKLEPEAVMRGDIDGDKKITLKDTQQILKAALCITELGTGETSNDTDNSNTDAVATNKPAGNDNNTEPSASSKPVNTAQPSATDNAGKTEPVQTEKPAATAEPTQTEQPDKPQNPVHTHGWEPVYKTVHHDEIGHYETVVVKDAWDEDVTENTTEGIVICNQCGMEFPPSKYGSPDAAIEAHANHVFDSWDAGGNCDNYRVESRTTGTHVVNTIHHPAVTEQKYVVDKAAYDEQVIDHYECTCGAKK